MIKPLHSVIIGNKDLQTLICRSGQLFSYHFTIRTAPSYILACVRPQGVPATLYSKAVFSFL